MANKLRNECVNGQKPHKDRFDIEQEIMTLYNFAQQLDLISEGILEYDMSLDDAVNGINGIKVLLNLHAQKMTSTMISVFNLKE
jgi:hypothetical protein